MDGLARSIWARLGLFGLMAACTSPANAVQGRQSDPATAPPKTVGELLTCLDRAAARLTDYTVTGTTESGGKTQRFTMAFLRPHLVRIDTPGGQVAVQPSGEIKGRLGRGPFGNIAQTLGRGDKRLLDAEGVPFYESDFVSMLARLETKIRSGAAASMQSGPSAYVLELQSGETVWRYRFAKGDLEILESSRSVSGQQVEITRYADFRANTGLKPGHFKF